MRKKFLNALLVGLLIIGITGCGNERNYNATQNNNGSSNSTINTNKKYKLGDTFIFDGLELTFDTTYSFVTLENSYSDKNGMSVIKLGVNAKNVSSEKNHLSMFRYDLFGSQGQELRGLSSYFDEAIDDGSELKPGASYKKYFYIPYDGDGQYSIDFDNDSQEISVEFDIKK